MKNKIIFIIFLIVGLLIMAGGIFNAYYLNASKTKFKEVQAVITSIRSYYDSDGDKEYDVAVKYFVNGKEYNARLNYYLTGMREGSNITVHYNIKNPAKLRLTSMLLTYFLVPFGLIFTLIGLIPLLKLKSNKKLKLEGMLIDAKITDITINNHITVNGRHLIRISFEYHNPFDGKVHSETSKNIYEHLDNFDYNNINLYLDPKNSKKYYLDIDSISKKS